MNREIKFRGRSSEDKKTWFTGLLYIEYGRMPNPIRTPQSRAHEENTYWIVFPGFADWIDFPGFADWNMPREMQRVQVDPETIGEYPGLKDKNGKEIYEGDILKRIDDSLRLVKWSKFGFQLYSPTLPDRYWNSDFREWEDSEVIGNIYENSELLKGY